MEKSLVMPGFTFVNPPPPETATAALEGAAGRWNIGQAGDAALLGVLRVVPP